MSLPARDSERSSARARPGQFAPACVLLLILAGCSQPAPPLSHTFDSPEALASAVVAGLARRDAAALSSLVLSEQEFRAHVWPVLPASRPERNLPFDYVWKDLHA